MKFPLLITLIVVLDIGAVLSAKYYVELKKPWILPLSLSAFAASGLVYVQLMEFAITPIINILYPAFSTIVTTLFFLVVFKERVTKGQWVGMGVAVIGILMLEVGI